MELEKLQAIVIDALEDLKAKDIKVIDVRGQTSVTDLMIIATGTSSRQVKGIADNVREKAKEAGVPPIGSEGEETGEWVLVDLGDIVVHVMQPQTRDFYQLERLWSMGPEDENADIAPELIERVRRHR